MNDSTPSRKVATIPVTAMAAEVLVWALHDFAGYDMPANIAIAIFGLIAFGVAYLVPDKP